MFGLVWLNIGQMTLTGNNIRPNLDFLSTDGTPGVVVAVLIDTGVHFILIDTGLLIDTGFS